MNERTRQGLHVLEAALLLGVLGDALLRATPWGLNFSLWASAGVVAAVALLERWRRAALKGGGAWLPLPVVGFAAAFAWRDSETLKWLDALAVACAFGLLAWRASGARVKLAGLGEYASGLARAALNTLFGAVPLVCVDVRWRELPRMSWTRHATAAARGLLIAAPLVFVFGVLFMAADAVFARLVNRTFQFDAGALFSHGLILTLCAWLAAGYFRGLLFGGASPQKSKSALDGVGSRKYTRTILWLTLTFEAKRFGGASVQVAAAPSPVADVNAQFVAPASVTAASDEGDRGEAAAAGRGAHLADDKNAQMPAPAAPRFALGAVEVGVVLGLLDALFLGFVCVQVRYLFGGAAWVAATGGLTYAEYARRGFFELVGATALALPLLLALDWLLRKNDPRAERLFRALAFVQLALLFVVIASALTRMRLYQREYGLTELRLYTSAFMGWLMLVFVWLAATVLRGARARFASGALVAACLVLGALHLVNPDATIVRANVAHARQQGRAFDAAYATTLSADAVPALVRALPSLSQDERCFAARRLLARWSQPADSDWRTWSMARSRAWRAVSSDEASLLAWACAPPPVAVVETPAPAQAIAPAPVAATMPATTMPMTTRPTTTAPPPATGARSAARKARARW